MFSIVDHVKNSNRTQLAHQWASARFASSSHIWTYYYYYSY